MIGALNSSSGVFGAHGSARTQPAKPDFEEFDADGSGSLDETEFSALQSAMQANGASEGASTSGNGGGMSFSDLDVDGDGAITQEELEVTHEQMMAELGAMFGMQPPPPPPDGAADATAADASVAPPDPDTDASGGLDIDEYTAMLEDIGVDTTDAESMFAEIDADGDGQITKEEYEATMGQGGGMPPPPPREASESSQTSSTSQVSASSGSQSQTDSLIAMLQNMISQAYGESGNSNANVMDSLFVQA